MTDYRGFTPSFTNNTKVSEADMDKALKAVEGAGNRVPDVLDLGSVALHKDLVLSATTTPTNGMKNR